MEKFLGTELFQVFLYSFRPIKSIRCFDSSSEEEETEDDFEQANPFYVAHTLFFFVPAVVGMVDDREANVDGNGSDTTDDNKVNEFDTSFFDGASCLLVTADPRKTNSRINESPHSHTKNQTRLSHPSHPSQTLQQSTIILTRELVEEFFYESPCKSIIRINKSIEHSIKYRPRNVQDRNSEDIRCPF